MTYYFLVSCCLTFFRPMLQQANCLLLHVAKNHKNLLILEEWRVFFPPNVDLLECIIKKWTEAYFTCT